MPVFHFILHAYGTWHPDHPSGYHQHGFGRPLKQDIPLGTYRRILQRWPDIAFTPEIQHALMAMARDICQRRQWRCHAVAVNETHVHIVVSWFDECDARPKNNTFKRVLGWHIASFYDQPGRPWLSAGGKPKRVANLEHLHYLVTQYLPNQGGVVWKEG